MKTVALGAALALTSLSWSAVAEEQASAQAPTEEQCKAMGEQHGMSGDKMDAWMKKCMDMSKQTADDMGKSDMGGMDDMNDAQDSNDMRDPEDGDGDMGGDKDK